MKIRNFSYNEQFITYPPLLPKFYYQILNLFNFYTLEENDRTMHRCTDFGIVTFIPSFSCAHQYLPIPIAVILDLYAQRARNSTSESGIYYVQLSIT